MLSCKVTCIHLALHKARYRITVTYGVKCNDLLLNIKGIFVIGDIKFN